MTPTTSSLLRDTGEMLAQFLRASPHFETYQSESAQLSITREPLAIMNPLVVFGSDPASATRDYAQLLRQRNLPSIAFVSPELSGEFGPIADANGFRRDGSARLMTYEPSENVSIQHDFSIAVASSESDYQDVLAVWERNTIPHIFYRHFGFACLDHNGVTAFIARDKSNAIATVTTTQVGSTVGIWGVHTLPDHRGKGVATAAVWHAINYHRDRGPTAFLLYATPMGRPVYEKMGFRSAVEPLRWVRQPEPET